jgi:hypothetical protein
MAHSVKYRKWLMVNGEQFRDHALIRLPFTLYRLPRRSALCGEQSESRRTTNIPLLG